MRCPCHALVLVTALTASAWGSELYQWGDAYPLAFAPPAVNDAVDVWPQGAITAVLRANGRMTASGHPSYLSWRDEFNTAFASETTITAIAYSTSHLLALRRNGTVKGFRLSAYGASYGQEDIPADLPPVKAVYAGANESAVLTTDNRLIVWGYFSATLAYVAPGSGVFLNSQAGLVVSPAGAVTIIGDDSNAFVQNIPDGLVPAQMRYSEGAGGGGGISSTGAALAWGNSSSLLYLTPDTSVSTNSIWSLGLNWGTACNDPDSGAVLSSWVTWGSATYKQDLPGTLPPRPIQIRSLNRTVVAISNRPPGSATSSALSIAELMPVGTLVGTVSATDPETGDTITYSLPAGQGANAQFAVSGNTIRTAVALDATQSLTRSIVVRASDTIGASSDTSLTVTLIPNPSARAALAQQQLALAVALSQNDGGSSGCGRGATLGLVIAGLGILLVSRRRTDQR